MEPLKFHVAETYIQEGGVGLSVVVFVRITDGPWGRSSVSGGDISSVSLGLPSDFHRASGKGCRRDRGAAWRGEAGRVPQLAVLAHPSPVRALAHGLRVRCAGESRCSEAARWKGGVCISHSSLWAACAAGPVGMEQRCRLQALETVLCLP